MGNVRGEKWKYGIMITLTTLAIVICAFAILVFFAQEFLGRFKKIFGLPGVTLFAPLVLASSVILVYEFWEPWLFLRVKIILNSIPEAIAHILPFGSFSIYLAKIIYLSCMASLPIWMAYYKSRAKGNRKANAVPFWMGLFLWVFLAMLLIVQ